MAAEGLTAREIAARLGVRERTVTTHLGRIYGKLGVGSRLAAVRIAARSGLVSVGARRVIGSRADEQRAVVVAVDRTPAGIRLEDRQQVPVA